MRISYLFLAALSLLPVACSQQGGERVELSQSNVVMGTRVDMIVLTADMVAGQRALQHAFNEMERVESLLSSHDASSQVSGINQQAGGKPVKIALETLEILERAIGWGQRLDGLFDITTGPLVNAWGFGKDTTSVLPAPDDIARLIALVNFEFLTLSRADTTARLTRKNAQIDLGGIAKGYAIDRAVLMLKRGGHDNFLINAGGDIYASGRKKMGKKWAVGIQHPRIPRQLCARLELSDGAIATSGDYERYKIVAGKRFHHIVNPKTGYPGTSNQSATILAPSAEAADVWATYLFLAGQAAFEKKVSPADSLLSFLISSSSKIDVDQQLVESHNFQFDEGFGAGKL